MRKRLGIYILLAGVTGVAAGLFLSVRLGWMPSLKAVEYMTEGEKLPVTAAPVQSAAFFGGMGSGLPSFSDLAERVGPTVVNISTTKIVKRRGPRGMGPMGPQDPFFDDFFEQFFQAPPQRPQKSLGSGFIINGDGHIITNNHVVEGADEVQVQLTDKRKLDAKIIGRDAKTDLAIIKITGSNLPSAVLGDSSQLRVGDWVMAVGNPFGLDHTVTAGIVSAKSRVIGAGPYDDFIQTDASINPGNSGGPLFNTRGEVVGVNTAIVSSGQGIGFAIPINMAKELIPQLISTGKVTRAWLGVGIQDITPELAKSFGLPDSKGALVSNVFPGSPADKGGLKSGDVIRAFNGKDIIESRELPALVAHEPVGKQATMRVLRDGKEIDLTMTLGEMEKGEKQADAALSKGEGVEMGLSCRDLTSEEMLAAGVTPDQRGVLVVGVEPGSAADIGGVIRGDVILSVNDKKVSGTAEFAAQSKKIPAGGIVKLFIKREDATIFLAFTK